jgi:hypothetical protein
VATWFEGNPNAVKKRLSVDGNLSAQVSDDPTGVVGRLHRS